ncbi:MAG: hypothetical protein IKN57_07560, partial [Parasporobacterium sp.]|nr:hypothetical protein [Parasporobacterium sp.]
AICSLLQDTIKELARNGLDKAALTASVNRYAYQIRQMQEPRGLIRGINSLNSWLYGGDPMLYLTYNDSFSELRAMVEGDGFDRLFETIFSENDNLCILHTLPSKTLGEEMRMEENARLKALQEKWTKEDLDNIIRLNKRLSQWQQTPDSPEQLSSLPVLSLSEVNDAPEITATEFYDINGVKLLYHPVPCNGIVYIANYFSMADYSLPELAKLSLIGSLYGNLPTKSHPDTLLLQQEIKAWLGSFSTQVQVVAKQGQQDTCTPYFVAACSVLEENLGKAKTLIHEILTETDFTAAESIRSIVLQENEADKLSAISSGHSLAASCALSHYSSKGAVLEALNGYTANQLLKDFAEHFEERLPEFTGLMEHFQNNSICQSRLTASVTASSLPDLSGLISSYPEGKPCREDASYKSLQPKNLAIRIPAQIGFATKASHLSEMNMSWNGSLSVVSQILSLDFLWNQIRVQGGAYGTGLRAMREGNITTYSFRDPSPVQSLKTFDKLAVALEAFCEDDSPIDRYIISTIAETEPLFMPHQKGSVADFRYFSGVTKEDIIENRRQILNCTKKDLLSWIPFLRDFSEKGTVCVVAHDGVMDACKEMGMTIADL